MPLREGGAFVAVGANHLYGSQGILALIERQGYQVQRAYWTDTSIIDCVWVPYLRSWIDGGESVTVE